MIGAIPIPESISKMKDFYNTICTRLDTKKCIVIYPEAHVWPYYTKIRPFGEKVFKLPIELNKPVFALTTTYQKRRFGKKVRITTYVDGPFFVDKDAKKDEKYKKMHNAITEVMQKRCNENSNYEYIEYIKKN